MAASLGPEIFSRGFRFNPTPLEAATYYLPRLLAGAPLHEAVRPVIHHADVYACEPGELARQFRPLPRTGHRFFFTHCKLQQPQRAGKAARATRAAGPGSWHSQGATDVVDSDKVKVGEMRKLRYKKGGAYTDWLMDEYSTCCSVDAVVGDRQYVFCNIYVSPRAAPDSAARQESAAFFAPPAPVVIAQAPPPQRPAPQVAEPPPCPKRTHGAVAPTPPVVQPAARCAAYFAPPRPCVPNRTVAPPSTPSVIRSSPAPAPTRLAAPPCRTPAPAPPQPKQQICLGGVAPPSAPSVIRSSPASAQPPAPAPTHPAARPYRAPAPAPPRPLGQPKQQVPPPPPPVVRACHMPVQAPARHCRPQPAAQTKMKTHDPFEAAEMRDEAEESPAALQDDDLAKVMEEAVQAAEAEEEAAANSTMTDYEMEQHIFSLLGNDTVIVPKEEIPDAIA